MPPLQQLPVVVNYHPIIERFVLRHTSTVACSIWKISDEETIFQRGNFFALTAQEKQDITQYFGRKKSGRNKHATVSQERFDFIVHRGVIFGESTIPFYFMACFKSTRVYVALFGDRSYLSLDKPVFRLKEEMTDEEN
ncbi:hypothetical protein CRE_22487 [Caenorhabditis remanei]|uniref:Uncharacterized protein n=1 Tax=Caenorhabditis remanei TaxID=31234 RepID=E3MU07_CAERE|nr:hypothetical protein CRE_22487 [Caenorhabditis remanei]